MIQIKIKLNIGCGPTGQIESYDNLDNSPSVILSKFPLIKKVLFKIGFISQDQYKATWSAVIRCDASKKLPYKNDSVYRIYSSHFLEHIPYEKGYKVLKECYRVLQSDGIMRLVVPDLLWHAERYVKGTQGLLNEKEIPFETETHDIFLNTVYGAYLKKKRYGAEHCYMYDLPSIVSMLKNVGFQNIRKCQFRQGIDLELASHDSRPEDSLHVEVRK